jgi:hypothetical protein
MAVKLLEMVYGKNLEESKEKVRENLECYQQSLTDDSSGSSEGQNANRNVDKKSVHEVSYGKEDSIGNWPRGNSCFILEKNWFTFCPCPKTE